MKRRHLHANNRSGRQAVCRVALAVGIILLLLALAAFLIQKWENKIYAVSVDRSESSAILDNASFPEITNGGITYAAKSSTEAYLVMGIDVSGPVVSVPGAYNGGQADALFLVVLDNEAKTWQLLRLNRDSMVDVPVLDLRGDVIGYEHQQLALAHAYGDGTRSSCENTVRTVSTLLGGQPIDGYASLHMDGIAVLNDAIGGVTLTVSSDFAAVDPTLVEGKTITLNGQQAMEYVRTRKDVDDQTNLARMERQRQYLEAMKPQLLALREEDIIRVYDALSDYLLTDLGSQEILDLAEKMQTYEELPELTIQGVNEVQNGHMAYILDQDHLQQVILELFYQEA